MGGVGERVRGRGGGREYVRESNRWVFNERGMGIFVIFIFYYLYMSENDFYVIY